MKKLMVILFAALAFILPTVVLAQTDTTSNGGGLGIELGPTGILVISAILGIYELLVRLIPTAQNWSVLGMVIKLIQLIFPNRVKPEVKTNLQEKAPPLP